MNARDGGLEYGLEKKYISLILIARFFLLSTIQLK